MADYIRIMQYNDDHGVFFEVEDDEILALGERIVEVLKQGRNTPIRVGCQVAIVYAVINGYLDSVPVNKVKEYEQDLYDKLENSYGELLCRIEEGYWENSDIEQMKKALGELQR